MNDFIDCGERRVKSEDPEMGKNAGRIHLWRYQIDTASEASDAAIFKFSSKKIQFDCILRLGF